MSAGDLVRSLPKIVFVLGKGGVGRSTVAAALGSRLASAGARTLVFGWATMDPISPWFGKPAAGLKPQAVAPNLSVANYRLEDTLELYFVEHLRLPRLYRRVIEGDHIRRLIAASPGLAEVFFIGHLWWLTTLAKEEAGIDLDHVVVDAPATGHGASLFDLPEALSLVARAGLLRVETERATGMMADPRWTGALVVTLPEELSAEETAELVPRVSHRLGRKPIAAIVNRSVAGMDLVADEPAAWLEEVPSGLRDSLASVRAELVNRLGYETALRALLDGTMEHGVLTLRDQLACSGTHAPRDVIRAVGDELVAAMTDRRP